MGTKKKLEQKAIKNINKWIWRFCPIMSVIYGIINYFLYDYLDCYLLIGELVLVWFILWKLSPNVSVHYGYDRAPLDIPWDIYSLAITLQIACGTGVVYTTLESNLKWNGNHIFLYLAGFFVSAIIASLSFRYFKKDVDIPEKASNKKKK